LSGKEAKDAQQQLVAEGATRQRRRIFSRFTHDSINFTDVCCCTGQKHFLGGTKLPQVPPGGLGGLKSPRWDLGCLNVK